MARAAKANSTKFISMLVSRPPGHSGGGFALGNNTANLDLQKLSTVMRCNIVIIRCVDAGIDDNFLGVEAGAGTCIYRPHIINSGGSGKTATNHALQQTAPGAVSIFVVACAAESAGASVAAAGEAAQPIQLLYAGLPNRSVKRAASLPPPATPWSVIVKFVSVHGFSFTEPAPSPKTIVFNDVASATIGSVVAACAPSLLPWGCEVLAIEKQGVSLDLSVPLRSAVPIMRSTLMAHCRKLQASALVAVSPQSGSSRRPAAGAAATAAAAAAAASAAAAATSDVSAAGAASADVSASASPMPKSSSSAKQHRGATAAAALHVVDDSAPDAESFNAGTAQQPVACMAMRTAVVQAYCAQRAMSAQLKAVETLQKAISAATQQLTTRAAAATTTSVEAAPFSTALVVMPQPAPPVKQRGSERAAAAANKRKAASELAAAASDGVEDLEFGGEDGDDEFGGEAGRMQLNHLLLNGSLLGSTRATALSLGQLALHQQLQEQQLHAAAAARQSSSSSPALQNQSHRLALMQQQLQADRIAAVAAEQQHHHLIMQQQQAARSTGAGRGSTTPFPATSYGLGGVFKRR